MYNVGIVQVGDQQPNFLGHPHGVVVHSGHLCVRLRLRLSPAAGSTGSISPNLARMILQLGPFVGSILPTATATAAATGSMLLVVGISVGRKVGLLLLSRFCRDGAARRRRPPFQVFSDGAALDMLQVNTRRGNDWSDAFDLTSAALLFYQPRERYTV